MKLNPKSILTACFCMMLNCVPLHGQHGKAHIATPISTGLHGIHTEDQAPIDGAHIYLFAVSVSGWDTNPTSLLAGTGVSTDGNGNGYVTTDSDGNFTITGLYASQCPSPDSRVYLLATGGSATGGSSNSAIANVSALLATCSTLSGVSNIYVDERTTIAALFALAPFANQTATPLDGFSTDSSSSAALDGGITYANNLVNSYTDEIVSGAPEEMINTLADILGACVNASSGSSSIACTDLMEYTENSYFTPTETFEAALSMAAFPQQNVDELYGLIPTMPAYTPKLASAPDDTGWVTAPDGSPTIDGINYTEQYFFIPPAPPIFEYTISGENYAGSPDDIVNWQGSQGVITSDNGSAITIQAPCPAAGGCDVGASGFIQVYSGGYGSAVFNAANITGIP